MAWDDEDDLDEPDDDEETTVPCPYCGVPVFDDAERCPSCGQYLSSVDAPRPHRPWWFVAGVVACLVAMLWWIVRL